MFGHGLFLVGADSLFQVPQLRQHRLGRRAVGLEGIEAGGDARVLAPFVDVHHLDTQRHALLDPVLGKQVEAAQAHATGEHLAAGRLVFDRLVNGRQQGLDFVIGQLLVNRGDRAAGPAVIVLEQPFDGSVEFLLVNVFD